MGWLTYLSRRLGKVPPLPTPVCIEPVGELGWLLVLSPDPMTASNPEHVAFTARVRSCWTGRASSNGPTQRQPTIDASGMK